MKPRRVPDRVDEPDIPVPGGPCGAIHGIITDGKIKPKIRRSPQKAGPEPATVEAQQASGVAFLRGNGRAGVASGGIAEPRTDRKISPRIHQGNLWLLDFGTVFFSAVDGGRIAADGARVQVRRDPLRPYRWRPGRGKGRPPTLYPYVPRAAGAQSDRTCNRCLAHDSWTSRRPGHAR